MIVFDESEYFNTALTDGAMRTIRLFLPPEIYDRLLYGGDKYVRLDNTSVRGVLPLRFKSYRGRHGAIRAAQNEGRKEANPPLYTMAYRR